MRRLTKPRSRRRMPRWFLTTTVATVSCATASGQQATTLYFADSRIVAGDWTFAPVTTDAAGQQPLEVVGFFAYADETTRVGDNLSAVWYQLDGEVWSAMSWQTTDLNEALKSARSTFGISNTLWELPPDGVFVGEPEAPKGFESGVLSTDPFAGILTTTDDPAPLVSTLVSIGYAAANVPVIGEWGCSAQLVLRGFASDSLKMILDGDETTLSTTASGLCARLPTGDPPVMPPKPPTAPPWSPPGTIPTAPAWTPGSWPTIGNPPTDEWRCFSTAGGQSCFCSRARIWGRWETYVPWIGPPRVRLHTIREIESCNANLASSCPALGPPPPEASCESRYE